MRETRRTLKAANTQLRSQIAVHEHSTRKALHEHIDLIAGRNKQLIEDYKKLETAYQGLQSQYAELVNATTAKAA